MVIKRICDANTCAMPPGCKYRCAAVLDQFARSLVRVIALPEQCQLYPVRGDHLGQWEQSLFHAGKNILVCKITAARSLDYRVGYHRNIRVLFKELHQHIDYCSAPQSASFNGVYGRVFRNAFELLTNQIRIDSFGTVYVPGILNSQAGEYRQRVTPKRCDGLNIRLDAGTAGRVQAGKNEYLRAGVVSDG